ncbi:hypothetical protein T439DRAFT_345300 [Meredithblackwellia eburnea MCA 4105]
MSVKVAPKQINPLLAAYLANLAARPILTKACTSGVLSFISEIAAGELSGTSPAPLAAKERTGLPPVDLLRRYHKAVKMAAYGFVISAPLGHSLLNILQKAFEGKTSARAKVAMIVCSNVFISPLTQSIYIIAMALIGGANSSQQVWKILKSSFLPVMKTTWVISTLCMAIAQKFLAPELWVPFFNIVGATVGTYLNVQAKKAALASSKTQAAKKSDGEEKKSN